MISNEAIVLGLLKHYKLEGLDMYYLLDDPIFKALPLADRLHAIKKHAAELAGGINPEITREERSALIKQDLGHAVTGAFTGLTSYMTAAKAFRGGATDIRTVAIPMAIGAGLGLVVGRTSANRDEILARAERRKATKGILEDLAAKRGDAVADAVGALSSASYTQKLVDKSKEIYGNMLRDATGKFTESMAAKTIGDDPGLSHPPASIQPVEIVNRDYSPAIQRVQIVKPDTKA